MSRRWRGVGVAGALGLAVVAGLLPAHAVERDALARAAALVGTDIAARMPDLRPLTPAPSELQPPALLRALQADPLQAPTLARRLRAGYADAARSVTSLVRRTAALYTEGNEPEPAGSAPVPLTGDALGTAMARLRQMAGQPSVEQDGPWPADVASQRPLRDAVARMLHAIVDAEAMRRQALAAVPVGVTPTLLRGQLTGSAAAAGDETLLRTAVARVDREALARGMQTLAHATERLAGELPALAAGIRVDWRWATPWGEVRIDTTGTHRTHTLHDPLLVVDVGGDDHYRFAARGERNRIAVLLDLGGDDRYEALADGADASAGVLGYGVLWDSVGDDRHTGGWLAQAAAVFGAALLVDGGGNDRFEATGLAQGYALAGMALLASPGAGDGDYRAGTYAQASAGPGAVAVLFDAAGNDRYTLQATPVVMPSSQLPDRNTSMGQGAGRGLRATDTAPGVAGGLGLLLDLAGDDHYRAQVFAQGAGYYLGVGLLIDGGGSDRFDAAWYAMAAAAHAGAGVLLDEGAGDDHYHASHSTSLGAGHDGAVAHLRDDGGNDRYELGDLGLGAAQDVSVALFVDAAGDDRYRTGGCHVLGVVRHSAEMAGTAPRVGGLGAFLDLGAGHDTYPAHCPPARDGAAWTLDGVAGFAAGIDQ